MDKRKTPVVQSSWHNTAEGETILQYLYNPRDFGRKLFGILESPLPTSLRNIEEVSYKLFFTGKSGAGKSEAIEQLAGIWKPHTTTSNSYKQTHGIQKVDIYWPVKIWDRIILFKLRCWEAGQNTLKKYSYILPACKEKADGIVFVFSFSDKTSFNELSQNIPNMMKNDHSNMPAVFVIGTRYDLQSNTNVNETDIQTFESDWQLSVLRMSHLEYLSADEAHKMAPILNAICEKLWIRDQDYILKQTFNRMIL